VFILAHMEKVNKKLID